MSNLNIKNILSCGIAELSKSAVTSTPELDARILLEEAIKKDRSFVFSHPEYLITNTQYSHFRSYIRRRKRGEGVAYILGEKEFYGHNFEVNKNVLIPRPETEWLVEKSIAFLTDYLKCHSEPEFSGEESREACSFQHRSFADAQDDKVVNVLDIGTGSGCIIISLLRSLNTKYLIHNTNFIASDVSRRALAIAKKNAKLNGVENIKFYFSDLFSNKFLHKKFDLIIANLPYVPRSARIMNKELSIKHLRCHSEQREESSEAIKNSIAFEPQDAIFADDNGTDIIKRFLIEAKDRLNKGGLILLEADCRNAKEISKFAQKEYPNTKIELKKDLAGLERYVEISNYSN